MSGFDSATLQALYEVLKGRAAYLGLLNGSTELSGGAYARVLVTWPTGSGGTGTAPAVTVNVPAGSTVDGFGVWAAATGGTVVGTVSVPSLTYNQAGTAIVVPTESVVNPS